MKAGEAYTALRATVMDIAGILSERGFICEVNCHFSKLDLADYNEYREGADVLYAEIAFGVPGDEQRAAIECAVSVEDGNVEGDEMLREISDMRAEARRIASLTEGGSAQDAFRLMQQQITAEDEDDGEKDPFKDERPTPKASLLKSLIPFFIIAAVIALILYLSAK